MEFEKGESSGLCRNFWGNPKQWFNLVDICEFAGASASITPTTGAQSNHCFMFDPGIEPSLRKKPAGLVRCLVRFLPEQTKSIGHSSAPALLLLSCLILFGYWWTLGAQWRDPQFSSFFHYFWSIHIHTLLRPQASGVQYRWYRWWRSWVVP